MRLGARKRLDIFEDLPFQEKVGAAYRAALASFEGTGMKIVRIDASRSVGEVNREVLDAIGAAVASSPATGLNNGRRRRFRPSCR